jgi:hypothetical protein
LGLCPLIQWLFALVDDEDGEDNVDPAPGAPVCAQRKGKPIHCCLRLGSAIVCINIGKEVVQALVTLGPLLREIAKPIFVVGHVSDLELYR